MLELHRKTRALLGLHGVLVTLIARILFAMSEDAPDDLDEFTSARVVSCKRATLGESFPNCAITYIV